MNEVKLEESTSEGISAVRGDFVAHETGDIYLVARSGPNGRLRIYSLDYGNIWCEDSMYAGQESEFHKLPNGSKVTITVN